MAVRKDGRVYRSVTEEIQDYDPNWKEGQRAKGFAGCCELCEKEKPNTVIVIWRDPTPGSSLNNTALEICPSCVKKNKKDVVVVDEKFKVKAGEISASIDAGTWKPFLNDDIDTISKADAKRAIDILFVNGGN